MCDQQSLRSACAYAQSDQSLCLSLEYSMSVKLLTEPLLEFLSLKGGYTGSSECTLVKMSNCWKSHATAHRVTCMQLSLRCRIGCVSACVSVGISFFAAAEYDLCCNFMCCRSDHVTYLKQQETGSTEYARLSRRTIETKSIALHSTSNYKLDLDTFCLI